MKTVVIDANNDSTVKLLLDLAKKMGLKAHVEKKRDLKLYPMTDDDETLDKMLNESESNFKTGNYKTAEAARKEIEKRENNGGR
ncbi:MAG: hypothetical protein M3R17_04335 [Bacteroidota bacterium]|nr:hypothetical protein [Bacteroidota bacterium]